jgi:type I restriction enzyme S subunit
MEKQKNVPKLRFSEFSDAWEVKKFDEIFLFSTGKNIKQNEASPDFETPCVRYGELYHMYNEVINEVINKTNLDKSELLFSEGNEILLPSAGEDSMDIGSASALTIKNVAIGRTINILKPLKDNFYSQIYVAYYINHKLKKDISKLAKGVSISNVYNSDLKTLKITLPNLPEQQKIATFLSTVDEKLQALKKKKSLLETYKKGVMQKLFSQEIRFKDDEGNDFEDWEVKRLGEVSDVRDGTHDSPRYVENGFPFITSKNLLKDGSIDFNNITFITEIDYKKVNQRSKVNVNDILFGMIGTIGNPVLVKTDGFAIKNVALIKEQKELVNVFLIHFLKGDSINQQFFEQNTGGTQKFLSLSIIRNLEVKIPSLTEQTKIANFLTVIDEKINKVDAQIKQTELWKKGLLQQMFV